MNDLKFAIRSLLKRPGFTFVAIVTLALGIGAATAIFSVVDAVLLRSLPFPQPERIVASEVSLVRTTNSLQRFQSCPICAYGV